MGGAGEHSGCKEPGTEKQKPRVLTRVKPKTALPEAKQKGGGGWGCGELTVKADDLRRGRKNSFYISGVAQ